MPLEVRDSADLEGAFERAVHERVDALSLVDNIVLASNVARVGALALTHRLPMMGRSAICGSRRTDRLRGKSCRPGAARRHLCGQDSEGRQSRGATVERPEKFDLVINLKTAQALGLTIPQSVLAEATELIQ